MKKEYEKYWLKVDLFCVLHKETWQNSSFYQEDICVLIDETASYSITH